MQQYGMFLFMMAATFLAVGLLTYGLAVYAANRRSLRDRFRPNKKKDDPLLKLRRTDRKSQIKNRLVKLISPLGKYAFPKKEEETDLTDLRMTLIRAGFRHSAAPAVYFGVRVLLAVGIPCLYVFYTFFFSGKATSGKLLSALMLAALGYYGPVYGLKFLASSRQDRIDRALPDVLDLMIVSMEAGLSLQATLNRVSEESSRISRELSRELQVTNAELRAGIPRDTALKNLAERTGVPSVKSLVALMIQSERMGASIAQALRNHASFTRVQRAQRAEEVAAKMPIKIIFPTLLCIFPSIFIVILGPAAISIYRTLVK